VSTSGNITPRASGLTSKPGRSSRENLREPLQEGKQMTAVATLAGAPTYAKIDWNHIDWKKANRNVRRLQARIVKAIEEGRWGKVKALQRLLTHSFSGKALAVRRVTENRGKRTPGPKEGARHSYLVPTRLSGPTFAEDLHTQKRW
jgi:RNA-directed DNA polymerase